MLSTGVNFSGGDENVIFSWGTIKENFEAIMDIGSDLLQNPLFPEEELELIRKQRIAILKEANKKNWLEYQPLSGRKNIQRSSILPTFNGRGSVQYYERGHYKFLSTTLSTVIIHGGGFGRYLAI